MSDRREFLKFLAGSPLLLAYPALLEAFTQAPTAQAAAATLASAADALDVFDFEAMARRVLPPAHWGYMATGVDGEDTLRANPRGFDRYQLRVRRFVDVSRLEHITITDNAIIPLKERVVDRFYDPVTRLVRLFK